MKVNAHKVKQLINRIEKQGLIDGMNYDGHGFCVIGHMGDMCGLLDETTYDGSFRYRHLQTFGAVGCCIHRDNMARHANTISEEFGIGLAQLNLLQDANDSNQGGNVGAVLAHLRGLIYADSEHAN